MNKIIKYNAVVFLTLVSTSAFADCLPTSSFSTEPSVASCAGVFETVTELGETNSYFTSDEFISDVALPIDNQCGYSGGSTSFDAASLRKAAASNNVVALLNEDEDGADEIMMDCLKLMRESVPELFS